MGSKTNKGRPRTILAVAILFVISFYFVVSKRGGKNKSTSSSNIEIPSGKELAAIAEKIQNVGIIPDVFEAFVPLCDVKMEYKGGVEVSLGNVLTPTQVHKKPKVSYASDPKGFYSLALVDPDAPSRTNPVAREWQHWLVVNIKGSDLSEGHTLTKYAGAGPPQKTGLHRYVFAVFKQPSFLQFDEPKIGKTGDGRAKFSIREFAKKYKLGNPIAVNFFEAEWDEYSAKVYDD